MEDLGKVYFYAFPLLVFGPLFIWVFYNFAFRELKKIPEQIRRQRELDAEDSKRFDRERERKRGQGAVGLVRGPNTSPSGYVVQVVTYAWFAAVLGFFASSPPYVYAQPDNAQIKLSLAHPGKRTVECRKRTRAELAKLPPNMRAAQDCPRERWPVTVRLELDGKTVYERTAKPKGLASDGPSVFYTTFLVPAGDHEIRALLRDGGDAEFNVKTRERMDLNRGRALAVTFDSAAGRFLFH